MDKIRNDEIEENEKYIQYKIKERNIKPDGWNRTLFFNRGSAS
jgi:hypothetical protein